MTTTTVVNDAMHSASGDLVETVLANSSTTAMPLVPEPYPLYAQVLIGLIVTVMILMTFGGNCLVASSVAMVKKLQTPSNYLIVSLACADLLVGGIVMPLQCIYLLLDRWPFSEAMCDLMVASDVLLCTSSILNLCAISVDRYFVITRPFTYVQKRTPKLMLIIIVVVWLAAALISIPPMFGWREAQLANQCQVSQNIAYQLYATVGAFYIPLGVMIVVYYRIFSISKRLAKSNKGGGGSPVLGHANNDLNRTASKLSVSRDSLNNGRAGESRSRLQSRKNTSESMGDVRRFSRMREQRKSVFMQIKNRFHHKQSSSDSKATVTLGVIMGAFTVCWLPFFILAVASPICPNLGGPQNCGIPPDAFKFFLWLGYLNSTLNPLIYARFNRDFRTPFKLILMCRCKGINTRIRHETFQEQYGEKSGGGGPPRIQLGTIAPPEPPPAARPIEVDPNENNAPSKDLDQLLPASTASAASDEHCAAPRQTSSHSQNSAPVRANNSQLRVSNVQYEASV